MRAIQIVFAIENYVWGIMMLKTFLYVLGHFAIILGIIATLLSVYAVAQILISSIGAVLCGIILFVNRIIAIIKNRSDKLGLKIAGGAGALVLATAGVFGAYFSTHALKNCLYDRNNQEIFVYCKQFVDVVLDETLLMLWCSVIVMSAAIILIVISKIIKNRAEKQDLSRPISSMIMHDVGVFLLIFSIVLFAILGANATAKFIQW